MSADASIWKFAKDNSFAIVSKDSDYSELAASKGFPPKLIWIQLGNCSTSEVESALRARLSDLNLFLENENLSIFELSRVAPDR